MHDPHGYGLTAWMLTMLTGMAFYYSEYNPFVGLLVGYVGWTAAIAVMVAWAETWEELQNEED